MVTKNTKTREEVVPIAEEVDIAHASYEAMKLAEVAGFNQTMRGKGIATPHTRSIGEQGRH